MLLTHEQSWNLRFQLPEATDVPADQPCWSIWIPIRWSDSTDLTAESGYDEVDDWKDDVFPAASLEAAWAHVREATEIVVGRADVDCGIQIEAA